MPGVVCPGPTDVTPARPRCHIDHGGRHYRGMTPHVLPPARRRASARHLTRAALVAVAACAAEPAPPPDPALTARFAAATHDQLGITLYTAADLVAAGFYRYMVVMASAANPGCAPMVTPGDVTFIGCGGSRQGVARAQNSSLRWPREGGRADPARAEILTATDLVLGATRYDGTVVRASPAGAVELGAEVAVESTFRFEHPWANSDSALALVELPDPGVGVRYAIAETSRIFVDGVGRAAVAGDLRVAPATSSSGYDLDGWLEVRGAETLRAQFTPGAACTPLWIDDAAVAPLCDW